jgi:hypothetical protein
MKIAYGSATGPLGFPLTDRQAYALDAILKAQPKDTAFAYRKAVIEKAPTELMAGERADVSWISTEDPDRQGDVVIAKGMNDSQFRLNPIVTLNHNYRSDPAGRSLWRKFIKDGELRGIKAKTVYPARPADWPEGKDWTPDYAFTLIQNQMLSGKSIGFLPTKVHAPTDKEVEKNGWQKVGLVIDEWILLEYACVFLPAQQNAVVEDVSKSLPGTIAKALGIEPAADAPFVTQGTIAQAITNGIRAIDIDSKIQHGLAAALNRHRGRVSW